MKKHGNVKTKGPLHDTSVYNRLISIATWLKQNPLFPMPPLLNRAAKKAPSKKKKSCKRKKKK